MISPDKENKAARRRERRRLRRMNKKVEVSAPAPKASETYPMLYSLPLPKTYAEGIRCNASVSVKERMGKSKVPSLFIHFDCEGRKYTGDTWVRDFSAEYFLPIEAFSQLGKSKKVISVDLLNPGGEKRGTLTFTGKTYSLLAQWGKLSIFGDIDKEYLLETVKEKVFHGFCVIIKEVEEQPAFTHDWEVKKGVLTPTQVDPTSVCTCKKCGAILSSNAPVFALPTRGCTAQ